MRTPSCAAKGMPTVVPGPKKSPVVVVSNRGPVSFRLDGDGRPVASAAGGLRV